MVPIELMDILLMCYRNNKTIQYGKVRLLWVETVEMLPNKTSTNIPIYIRLILSFEWLGKSDLTHNHNLARR